MGSRLIQTAFVVNDIGASMSAYVSRMKIGPWFLMEEFTPAEALYHGKPTSLVISVAFAFQDSAMLELIQQHDDSPSVFRDVVSRRGYGLHHVGLTSDSYELDCASYVRSGLECVFSAKTTGRLAMFQTAELSHMIEILELDPRRERFFSAMAKAAAEWDGEHPVRDGHAAALAANR